MSKLWKKLDLIAPAFGVYCLLMPTTKVMANENLTRKATSYAFLYAKRYPLGRYAKLDLSVSLAEGKNVNQLNKNTLDIIDRQANLSNSFKPKTNNTNKTQLLLAQVNSVEQLKDIKPTDWSYEALRGLIERYSCINGFLDQTYRGQESISRAEFVAGLNICLNEVEKILANSDQMPQTDVDTVLRLMQEFQSDLAILQGRTDGAQARVDDLEAIQFSTTSKLQGEAIIGFGDVLSQDNETNAILGSRLRLDLKTSFSGNDLLFTRLSRNDFSSFADEVGTFQGNLSFADSDTNNLQIEELSYSFGVIDRLDFILGATGVDAEDIAPTINVLDGDGGSGSISAFGTRNPIYEPPGDAGVGVVHRPIDRLKISAGYLASPTNESNPGSGLFDGPYSALGQVTIAPFDGLSLAATYVHSYSQSDTNTGTNKANLKSETTEVFGEETPTVSNSYGLELSWAISDRIVVGGWGGLSKVSNLSTLNQQVGRGTQDIWNWTASLAFPDLGREGSMAGILVGSEPTVTSSTIDNLSADSTRSLHLEAFYQYQISDNIAITPGVVWITEPDSNIPDSNDLVIGTFRTTFSF